MTCQPLFFSFCLLSLSTINAFTASVKTSVPIRPVYSLSDVVGQQQKSCCIGRNRHCRSTSIISMGASDDLELKRVSPSLENVPLPFIDTGTNSYIECYADSVVTIDDVTYTIAVPCDYSVALCYFDGDDNLIPVELNDPLMDDIFPIAESIVAEEFGEELVLQRTPQTLTLVGELEEEDDEADDEDEDDYNEEDEEVEVLLSFDHRGQEFSLVRLLDPILLVGKENPDDATSVEEEGGTRLLLSPQESDTIMPILEDLFLKFHDNPSKMP